MDYKIILAGVSAVLVIAAWMFRYEIYGQYRDRQRNRFTGAVCYVSESCWFTSNPNFR
jgi:hypothetical protein